MRELGSEEVLSISGAGTTTYNGDGVVSTCPDTKSKNNNGYGNGAEFGPPPGNSGAHNTHLLADNLGPRGVR